MLFFLPCLCRSRSFRLGVLVWRLRLVSLRGGSLARRCWGLLLSGRYSAGGLGWAVWLGCFCLALALF